MGILKHSRIVMWSYRMVADVVFETSFEICNKVGGIHTVVSSKSMLANAAFSEYILVGPWFPTRVSQEFIFDKTPPSHWTPILERLERVGVRTVVGRWLVPGEPRVILVDFAAIYAQKNEFKKQLWERFGVDSLNAGFDFDEPLTFSLAVGMLIEMFATDSNYAGKKIISQSHEWMTGFVNLYLQLQNLPKTMSIRTVFTTHATILGRAIAGSGQDVFQVIKSIDSSNSANSAFVDNVARSHGVFEKFTAERACANNATVFTTVSDLTAKEAKALLGRQPDIITQNGLPMRQFPSFEQASIVHAASKARLFEFFKYFFFQYHQFDLSQTLTFFVSGRYEFRNKGMDVTIQALGKLNERLVAEKSTKTIVTVFIVPMQQFGVRRDLYESKLFYRNINQLLTKSQAKMHDSLLAYALSHPDAALQMSAITPEFAQELRRLVALFDKPTNIAPLCTHQLGGEGNNEILQAFSAAGLRNEPANRVKVILYPVYLEGSDGLLDMTYYDSINGCHLGLFASFYEPWGYTPLECAALGVPAVTTTSAGFGQFVVAQQSNVSSTALPSVAPGKQEGIFVLDRLHKSDADIVHEYTQLLYEYAALSHHERVKHKIAAKLLAEKADWSILFKQYLQAYELALSR